MGKRSNFERRERDFYPTNKDAVKPLLPHLPIGCVFGEPMAGAGDLVNHLVDFGHKCIWASDIEPQGNGIIKMDVMDCHLAHVDFFITNPPWPAKGQGGNPTVEMIEHLSDIAPTWLLLSADFAHNVYFAKVADRCRKIVSVGRVKWIPDSPFTGKDNASWFLFDKPSSVPIEFHGRAAA